MQWSIARERQPLEALCDADGPTPMIYVDQVS
jgi:hypothetical protein